MFWLGMRLKGHTLVHHMQLAWQMPQQMAIPPFFAGYDVR
jgi:hypothetical protein